MWSRQKGFEPEVYLKKAEADIQAVQMQCSLAEPAWDGRLPVCNAISR